MLNGAGSPRPPPSLPHSCARAQGWASWGARDGALRRTPIFGIKARSAGKWGPSDVKGWTRRGPPSAFREGRLCPAGIVRDHPLPQARAPGLCDPLSSPGAGSAPQKSQEGGQSVSGAGERDARNPARPTRQRQTLWRGRGVAGRGATPPSLPIPSTPRSDWSRGWPMSAQIEVPTLRLTRKLLPKLWEFLESSFFPPRLIAFFFFKLTDYYCCCFKFSS